MILITGATGFVGSHLIRRLADRGEQLRLLTRSSSTAGDRNADLRRERLEGLAMMEVEGDITDRASLVKAMKGVSTVIHLVAVIRENRSRGITYQTINVQGTKNLVDAAREAGVQYFIHMGALGAANDPQLRYVYSKWLGEEYVRKSGLSSVILEPSIIFGPEDEFVNQLADLVKMAPVTPVVGSGKILFQPIHVDDVAACIVKLLDKRDKAGQTIQIGGPDYISYEGILDEIIKTLGVRRLKIHMPVGLMKPVVSLMELILPHPPVTRNQLQQLNAGDNTTTIDAVEQHFGFRPRPLYGNISYVQHGSWLDAYKRIFNAAPIGAPPPDGN